MPYEDLRHMLQQKFNVKPQETQPQPQTQEVTPYNAANEMSISQAMKMSCHEQQQQPKVTEETKTLNGQSNNQDSDDGRQCQTVIESIQSFTVFLNTTTAATIAASATLPVSCK